jgi:TonB dependent receptor
MQLHEVSSERRRFCRGSKSSTLYNLQVGVRTTSRNRLTLDVINLFDANVNDVDYYYASSLRSDPYYTYPNYVGPCPAGKTCGVGVNDIHFHPAVRRTLRVYASFPV